MRPHRPARPRAAEPAAADAAGPSPRDDYATLERQIAELGNQCVVMERLHGTLDHAEVLAGIQDVVINVIGSEELAVFEPTADGAGLVPTQTFGVEERRLGRVAWGEGTIGRAAAEAKGWVVGEGAPPADFPDLTACVPLSFGGNVAGVLAFWRMLAHKPVFGDADRVVLDLVARHAATALLLTSSDGRGRGRVAAGEAPTALPGKGGEGPLEMDERDARSEALS